MFIPKVNFLKSTCLYRSLLKFFLNILVFSSLTTKHLLTYFELNFGGVGSGQVGDQGVTRQAEVAAQAETRSILSLAERCGCVDERGGNEKRKPGASESRPGER